MKEMTERLAEDEELAAAYAKAHEHYLAQRAELGDVPEIDGHLGRWHADPRQVPPRPRRPLLGRGPGVNPLGDEALAMLDEWWRPTSCAAVHAAEDAAASGSPGATHE